MSEIKTEKFDDSLKKLEAIVKKLESDLPIDEALSAFEQGIALSKSCMDELKKEKGKLALLVDDLNKITEEFDIKND